MKAMLLIGLVVVFLNLFVVHCDDIKNGEMNLLCILFPETFEDLCNKKDNEVINFVNDIENDANKEIEIKSGTDEKNCRICKIVIRELLRLIVNKKSPNNIRNALKIVCRFIPPIYGRLCKKLVKYNTDKLVQMIMNNIPIKKICKSLNLCSIPMNDEYDTQKQCDRPCNTCIKLIYFMEVTLNTSLTPANIQKNFIKMCQIFKSPIKNMYIQIINKYGLKIITRILKKDNPKDICKMENVFQHIEEIVNPEGMLNDDDVIPSISCSTCKTVTKTLKNLLNKQISKDQITNALDSVCYFFENTITSDCINFIAKYRIDIINLLDKDKTPGIICDKIVECSKNEEQRSIDDYLPKFGLL